MPSLPVVSLELVGRDEAQAAFADAGEPIGWQRRADGEPRYANLLAHPTAGYLMFDREVGHFQISPNGERIRCAPADDHDWRWQRYLLGRVLPFTATLRGLEPWHSSAVALEDGAIAFMANSGVGKTTIAAELTLRGAGFLADDVIALRLTAEPLLVYPGPPLMSVRTGAGRAFGDAELAQLGERVGHEAGSVRLSVERTERAHPLRLVYLLDRETAAGEDSLVPAEPDPRRLIGGTFNFALRSPERLRRQLEVAAAIASHAKLVRVGVAPGSDLRRLAARILEDARARMDDLSVHA